jgi:Signal transduction histidine kinase
MKISTFLKDKLFFLIGQLFVIGFVSVLLGSTHFSAAAIFMVCGLILLISILTLLQDYTRRNHFYRNLYDNLDGMEQKQYIASMLTTPTFADAEILNDVLSQSTKAMNDSIASYQVQSSEYREYIETWIHEVKIPISCISLLCENSKCEAIPSIVEQTDKIDAYVEQALFYARSTNLEKDYSIRSVFINQLLRTILKKYSKQLIACKTSITLPETDYTVYTDPKWMDFILGQIISNSIKYKSDNLQLSFSTVEEDAKILLYISDNGIGIPVQDLGRVFEKGFTGENGRRFAKSTGIGLYLCKQLSEKMGLGFSVTSQEQLGTTIGIIFPKDKLTMLSDLQKCSFSVSKSDGTENI